MNMMKSIRLFVIFATVAAAVAADAAEMRRGPWRLSVGSAWRERVKSSISGGVNVTPVPPSFVVSYDVNVPSVGAWTGAEPNITTVTDPLAPPLTLYAATATRTETTVTPGAVYGSFESDDERGALGVKASAGFDFYDDGTFAVGFDLRFAAYWDMKSEAVGTAGGGTTTVNTFTDYYLFSSGPYPVTAPGAGWALFLPDTTPYVPYRTATGSTTTPIPASLIRAKVTSDLYQIGLGPTFSLHALEWLDAYAKAAALCNIAHMDVDVNYSSSSSTVCRFGVGGEIGVVAWVTDNLGLYSEVGYEWIDGANAKNGSAKAKTDFSSLVVSAGVMLGF